MTIACATTRFVASETATQTAAEEALRQRVAALEAALAAKTSELAAAHETVSALTAERNKLRRAYELLKGQLELIRRRIFVAKAERIDTSQLEIEFAETKAKLEQLARVLDDPANALGHAGAAGAANQDDGTENGRPANKKRKRRRAAGGPI
jgi:transposase